MQAFGVLGSYFLSRSIEREMTKERTQEPCINTTAVPRCKPDLMKSHTPHLISDSELL